MQGDISIGLKYLTTQYSVLPVSTDLKILRDFMLLYHHFNVMADPYTNPMCRSMQITLY